MAFALVGTSVATAQTTFPKLKIGDNPRTLNVNAVLELESANKGFLLPRVELSATNSAEPLTGHVAGMTVYNTAESDATVADDKKVTPGYYYNDGNQWVRIAAGTDIKPEPWFDQATNTEATDNEQDIYQMGKVAIGVDEMITIQVGADEITPTLHVAGDVSTTGKFWTTNSVYADYVFEKYFDGASDINEAYEFKSLDYIKAFVAENKHLPGVTKIDDLLKDENGYLFDMTALSIQQLEKIEELFLHTIEQQEQINRQQTEIEEMKVRLERLEKLLNTEK